MLCMSKCLLKQLWQICNTGLKVASMDEVKMVFRKRLLFFKVVDLEFAVRRYPRRLNWRDINANDLGGRKFVGKIALKMNISFVITTSLRNNYGQLTWPRFQCRYQGPVQPVLKVSKPSPSDHSFLEALPVVSLQLVPRTACCPKTL